MFLIVHVCMADINSTAGTCIVLLFIFGDQDSHPDSLEFRNGAALKMQQHVFSA